MMEPVTLSFSAVLIMGFLFGAGPCNIACLPYLGPVFLARDGGVGGAWRTILPFSLGRMSGYAILGAVAGGLGYVAASWLEEGPARYLLGAVSMALGLVLWRRAGTSGQCAAAGSAARSPVQPLQPQRSLSRPLMPVTLFGMGAAMALNPCAPLGTVLLAAAATASVAGGFFLGVGFGLGAVVVPALIFGVLVAHFGAQVRAHLAAWRKVLERTAAVLLIALGGLTMAGVMTP